MAAGGERFPQRGFAPILFGKGKPLMHPAAVHAAEEFLVAGCRARVDPSVPRGELHLEDEHGVRLLTVKGLER